MILNKDGIAVLNRNARNLYAVQMIRPHHSEWVFIPADDAHEAEVVADNTHPHMISKKSRLLGENNWHNSTHAEELLRKVM